MKLGIAVVYVIADSQRWVFRRHLLEIRRCTQDVPYRIYAASNRLLPDLQCELNSAADVEVVPLPDTDLRGNREHGFYLDRLVATAFSEGCTHVAVFDADSWPICRSWAQRLAARMEREKGLLSGVLRSENGDICLPHPSGMLITRQFFEDVRPTFFPEPEEEASEEFWGFLAETGQRVDTGIGYAYALWRQRLPWVQLCRSNRHNDHFLMAGIYGGMIFHLGGASRTKQFHRQLEGNRLGRWLGSLKDVPVFWRLSKLHNEFWGWLNERNYHHIITQLQSDPEKYYRYLLEKNSG